MYSVMNGMIGQCPHPRPEFFWLVLPLEESESSMQTVHHDQKRVLGMSRNVNWPRPALGRPQMPVTVEAGDRSAKLGQISGSNALLIIVQCTPGRTA